MPELPEVQALVDFLSDRVIGRVVARIDVASIAVVKTFDPPISGLAGLTVCGVSRHGKFLDLDVDGLHLVAHLSRAGWLHWRESLPPVPPKPGKNPIALRVHLDTGAGFDLTEAGTQKRLAVYVVRDPLDVPGIARLGPEPLTDDFTLDLFASLLAGNRTQLKGVLRDQSVIAGIGNAYSDEILHVAKMSPFRLAATLDEAEVKVLYDALRETMSTAVERARGLSAGELKAEKKLNMRVHGRSAQPCPVCGDVVRQVSFATSALDYCATCQTGGKPLADRRMSRLLK
ncbi:MAG TPA: DNA-formamidopyrimidine glycosylase family protein [Mycobacteriales bacterium]|jgi:formamidopyrimidine-DNA glycosylase|nr:DNA-formamidopyrimidine glycosylase family protein [Mycobacteriales bacterium]